MNRRDFFVASSIGFGLTAAACSNSRQSSVATAPGTSPADPIPADTNGSATTSPADTSPTDSGRVNNGRWRMPAEEHPHDATWMCWPSSEEVWGETLPDVQDALVRVALAISEFEPVRLLARPDQIDIVRELVGGADVEVIEAPVDDLWARDTLPCFLLARSAEDAAPLAAGRVQFNGWGNKQLHGGDAQLAKAVADHLGIPLVDSGLIGEGGGLEVDGAGTVMAARSSWVNENRNPGIGEEEIGARLGDLLGAERIIWVDGIAGEDITDSHIDTLARFVAPGKLILDKPAFDEPGETWFDVSVATKETLAAVGTDQGGPFEFNELVQPKSPRGQGDSFLSSYVNYYVCNGGIIAPSFGDAVADSAAADQLGKLYPGRRVVQVDIDAIAAGGGGIHCATQQQPALSASSDL